MQQPEKTTAKTKEQRKRVFDQRKPKFRFVFRFLLSRNRNLNFWFRFRHGRNSLSTRNFGRNSLSTENSAEIPYLHPNPLSQYCQHRLRPHPNLCHFFILKHTFLLTFSLMTLQNNYSSGGGTSLSLKWLFMAAFWGFHQTIPLGHKWKARCHKMSPLALKLVVLKPNHNTDPELENR